MLIRPETESDWPATYRVNVAAFERDAEARLVDMLRDEAEPTVSLVAQDGTSVLGHIMFSPVSVSAAPTLKFMGLGPMAVTPDHQREGIGGMLVRAGLDECKRNGIHGVVVLGHPQYYPRFGFSPASRFGLSCEYDVPDEAFMATEIQPGAFDGASGLVKYHAAFNDV